MKISKSCREILNLLYRTYPEAKITLNYSNNWELLVAVILSAQCTDKKVNEVTAKLFEKYRTLEEYSQVKPAEFEKDIRSTGFYRNKTRNILKTAVIIKEKYSGKVPRTMSGLVSLPGVARKTANIVLGAAFGKVEGIAVDTHVFRIAQRLRLVDPEKISGNKKIRFRKNSFLVTDFIKNASTRKIEKELMKNIPKIDWMKLNYLLIEHGRSVCRAQRPLCFQCALNKICPVSRL